MAFLAFLAFLLFFKTAPPYETSFLSVHRKACFGLPFFYKIFDAVCERDAVHTCLPFFPPDLTQPHQWLFGVLATLFFFYSMSWDRRKENPFSESSLKERERERQTPPRTQARGRERTLRRRTDAALDDVFEEERESSCSSLSVLCTLLSCRCVWGCVLIIVNLLF